MSRFPTTIWTVIRGAGAGQTAAQEQLVERYRPAVVRFAQLRGVDAQEAEDVAQEVFLRLFDDRVLERADRRLGRFRSLVLAVTRHVLGHVFERRRARRRGGGSSPLSLDAAALAASVDGLATRELRDPDFDREWLSALLSSALRRLKRENEGWYASVHAFLVEEKSHREAAETLGKTEAAVRNAISRGRARLAAIVREEIASYCSSAGELDDEVRYLQGLLGLPAG